MPLIITDSTEGTPVSSSMSSTALPISDGRKPSSRKANPDNLIIPFGISNNSTEDADKDSSRAAQVTEQFESANY